MWLIVTDVVNDFIRYSYELIMARFAVREYEHDPQALEAESKEKEKLERDLKRQFVSYAPLFLLFLINAHR